MMEQHYNHTKIPPLDENNIVSDPILLFEEWFRAASDSGAIEPTAMTLATTSKNGATSARMVLLKEYCKKGFVFYTNYTSRKGQELDENPQAALVFWWNTIRRQVRIRGFVEKVSEKESDAYFHSRPRDNQISAWASPQSQVVNSRDELKERVQNLAQKHEGQDVPRPDFWGGYRVIPYEIEFWQDQPGRLHDRILYTWTEGIWRIERLAP